MKSMTLLFDTVITSQYCLSLRKFHLKIWGVGGVGWGRTLWNHTSYVNYSFTCGTVSVLLSNIWNFSLSIYFLFLLVEVLHCIALHSAENIVVCLIRSCVRLPEISMQNHSISNLFNLFGKKIWVTRFRSLMSQSSYICLNEQQED